MRADIFRHSMRHDPASFSNFSLELPGSPSGVAEKETQLVWAAIRCLNDLLDVLEAPSPRNSVEYMCGSDDVVKGVEEVQRVRLNGPAQQQRTVVGRHAVDDIGRRGLEEAIDDETKATVGRVLADEDDRPMKVGVGQHRCGHKQYARFGPDIRHRSALGLEVRLDRK